MLSLDNSTEVLKNTTAAFTKKIALAGKLWTKFYFNYIKLSLIILLIKLLMLMHVESTECDIKAIDICHWLFQGESPKQKMIA